MTCSICTYEWCWLCGSSYSTAHFNSLNPFGCPGLQDRPRDDWGKCRILLLRIGLILLFIIGLPVVLPLAMVGCGPVLVSRLLMDTFYPYSCLKKFGTIVLGSILGLIADPFVWLCCLFYFVPKGIIYICEWFR
jgi:hypothetical protein